MTEFYPEDDQANMGEANLVDEVKAQLQEIDSSDLSEHSKRFEALHGKLHEKLSTIDGL